MKVLSILSSLVLFDLSSSDPSPSWGAIVGGTNVTEVEYPTYDYQVELDIFLEDGRVLGCGGTKVAENWVLTAAHCTMGRPASSIKISSGSRFPGQGTATFATAVFESVCYEAGCATNYDAALLYLEGGVPGSSAIAYATTEDDTAIGTELVVTGWGTLTSGGDTPTVLQKATVPVVECDTYPSSMISNAMFCAGILHSKDSCQGDSGGPIVKFETDETGSTTPILVGIVSWGIGCADEHAGVYTDVAFISNWIDFVIANSSMPTDYNANCECCGLTQATCPRYDCGTHESVPGWHDIDGTMYSCGWYELVNCHGASDPQYENDGMTASQACCECGGGVEIASTSTSAPTSALTSAPTPAPTPAPTSASTNTATSTTTTTAAPSTSTATPTPSQTPAPTTQAPTKAPSLAPTTLNLNCNYADSSGWTDFFVPLPSCRSSSTEMAITDFGIVPSGDEPCTRDSHSCMTANLKANGNNVNFAIGCVSVADEQDVQDAISATCSIDPSCAADNKNTAITFTVCATDDCNSCTGSLPGNNGSVRAPSVLLMGGVLMFVSSLLG